MKRNTRGVVLTLTALVMLGLATYSPAAAQKFSEWSPPVNLGPTINSASWDFAPAISKKGLSLYITSNRPGGFGSRDIWVSQRATLDDPWGTPVNLGPNINTIYGEATPNFSRDGHWMFFVSNRPGGLGDYDIWTSWRAHTDDDFGWQPPMNLGAGVNSAALEWSPHYFENEDVGIPELFFHSNRPGGLGGSDIYVSARASNGSFNPAVLVRELSSPQEDGGPSLRHDGREIFFESNRPGGVGGRDLWVSTRETTRDAWATPVNLTEVNSAGEEARSAISSDGLTLFFASYRPGVIGGLDLYMSVRTKLRGR